MNVLLVEDDPSQVALGLAAIKSANNSGSGRELIPAVARDGVQAVEALTNNHYDMVLLDLRMPRMDGFEVLKFIKTHPTRLKYTPVVIMTTSDMAADVERALNESANAYMVKPLSQAKMIDLFKRLRGFWGSDDVRLK